MKRNSFIPLNSKAVRLSSRTSKAHKLRKKDYYGGMDCRVFINKDSPDYSPPVGDCYTERQLSIINGEIPYDDLRLSDLAALIRKADAFGDIDTASLIQTIYNAIKYKDRYEPKITYEEALEILSKL